MTGEQGELFALWDAADDHPRARTAYVMRVENGLAWIRGCGLGVRKGCILRLSAVGFGCAFEIDGVRYFGERGEHFEALGRPYFPD